MQRTALKAGAAGTVPERGAAPLPDRQLLTGGPAASLSLFWLQRLCGWGADSGAGDAHWLARRRGFRSVLGVPLGALDGVPGDVPDLAVAGLGLAGEQVERLVGGDVVLPDEDALRLVDDRPGLQGAAGWRPGWRCWRRR